jgi:hypothetical protein
MHGAAMLPKAQPAKPTQGSTASMLTLAAIEVRCNNTAYK